MPKEENTAPPRRGVVATGGCQSQTKLPTPTQPSLLNENRFARLLESLVASSLHHQPQRSRLHPWPTPWSLIGIRVSGIKKGQQFAEEKRRRKWEVHLPVICSMEKYCTNTWNGDVFLSTTAQASTTEKKWIGRLNPPLPVRHTPPVRIPGQIRN